MEKLIIIILMGLVTYIPRLVPITVLDDKKLPSFLKSFLQFIPFAALGALIFPEVLYSTKSISSAVVGCLVSIVCAFFRFNVVVVVFAGILGVFIFETIL